MGSMVIILFFSLTAIAVCITLPLFGTLYSLEWVFKKMADARLRSMDKAQVQVMNDAEFYDFLGASDSSEDEGLRLDPSSTW